MSDKNMHTIDIDAIMLEIKNKAQQRRQNLFRDTSQETTPIEYANKSRHSI